MSDSLQVIEEDDGSMTISWDEKDPQYSFLNNLSEEQLKELFVQAFSKALEESESEDDGIE